MLNILQPNITQHTHILFIHIIIKMKEKRSTYRFSVSYTHTTEVMENGGTYVRSINKHMKKIVYY